MCLFLGSEWFSPFYHSTRYQWSYIENKAKDVRRVLCSKKNRRKLTEYRVRDRIISFIFGTWLCLGICKWINLCIIFIRIVWMAENITLFCNCPLLFPTEFILDLPLRVDGSYIALITNTLDSNSLRWSDLLFMLLGSKTLADLDD